jgi:hypothetical protein
MVESRKRARGRAAGERPLPSRATKGNGGEMPCPSSTATVCDVQPAQPGVLERTAGCVLTQLLQRHERRTGLDARLFLLFDATRFPGAYDVGCGGVWRLPFSLPPQLGLREHHSPGHELDDVWQLAELVHCIRYQLVRRARHGA